MSFSWENEWRYQKLKEESFLTKHILDKTPKWVTLVRRKIPVSLQRTLESAFGKAFYMVFEKGTDLIEKTYKKDAEKHLYKKSSKRLKREGFSAAGVRRFDRQSKNTIRKNLVISGVEGLAFGLGGMGIPDIPVFVSVMLKSIYEIAISFGYGYTSLEEKIFILKLIDTSLKSGDELRKKNDELNKLIDIMSETDFKNDSLDKGTGNKTSDEDVLKLILTRQIDTSAEALSRELLYGKFIQGNAIIGVFGGLNDVTCLKRITDYAVLKYKRRFLLGNKE